MKSHMSIGLKPDTYKKLKIRKEVHGLTYDELIRELLEK